jgi:hypothetical protein
MTAEAESEAESEREAGQAAAWKRAGLDAETHAQLAERLPASSLWTLLLDVLGQRAAQRTRPELLQQWERDIFVTPSSIDQRTLHALDGHLLAAASAFEAIELSPLAPLGVCSVIGLGSQNRIVSALRGTEVVADPTNVLALECARRMRTDPMQVVRLATCHRCVRAQPFPKTPGFTQHFRLFCLVTGGREQKNHAFLTDTLIEHITTHVAVLDRLEQHGYHFPNRRVRVLATKARTAIADRVSAAIASARPELDIDRGILDKPYYDGLRFTISARGFDGEDKPFTDGGAFTWLADLTSNRKMALVCSAIGTQQVAAVFNVHAFNAASPDRR